MAEDASLELRGECVCDVPAKRQMWVAWRSGVEGTYLPTVHANCVHNEVAALRLRSLARLPGGSEPPISPAVRSAWGLLRSVVRRFPGVRWDLMTTALSYGGAMRRRYVEAERSLREDGYLRRSDSRLRAFLKAEKLGASKDEKPRMIFPRDPRFNLVVASWLKPLEHWLWGRLTARRLFGGGGGRVVGKGLSPVRRANLIRRKMGQFRRPACFEVDGKAFEAHVTQNHLDEERSVYKAAYGGDRGLGSVLAQQVFAGTTRSGVKFRRLGGRASGDFNTGMGNTLIMLAVLLGVLKSYRLKFDLLVDGDNALVFFEACDYRAVVGRFASDVFESSGFEMTLESPAFHVEGVRFGRSAPVLTPRGWTMVRPPLRVASGAWASHKWLREPVFGRRWCLAVAQCELSLALGVPVLQALALSVLKQLAGVAAAPDHAVSDYLSLGAWRAGEEHVVPVDVESRLSFERAFGISPREQVELECRFARVALGHPQGVVSTPCPSRWREALPGLFEAYWDAHI